MYDIHDTYIHPVYEAKSLLRGNVSRRAVELEISIGLLTKRFIAYRLKAPVTRVDNATTLGEYPNESEDISYFG